MIFLACLGKGPQGQGHHMFFNVAPPGFSCVLRECFINIGAKFIGGIIAHLHPFVVLNAHERTRLGTFASTTCCHLGTSQKRTISRLSNLEMPPHNKSFVNTRALCPLHIEMLRIEVLNYRVEDGNPMPEYFSYFSER